MRLRAGATTLTQDEVLADGQALTLRISRELQSPNKWQGRHWRVKHRNSQEWEQAIWVALAKRARAQDLRSVLLVMNALPPKRVCQEKRRVMVIRQVPSARNFIRDDDNLRFATKPLNDALKRLGLIRDDSRKWLEQPMPVQEVSPTGGWATLITIERALGASGGRERASGVEG